MQEQASGEPAGPSAKPSRLRQTLSRALLVLIASYATYLVVGNALLFTGAFAWLVHSKAPPVQIEAGTSYSLWPGRVFLRNVRVEVTDSNVHLLIEAPRGRLDVRVTSLLRQRFVAESVSGSNFVIQLRPNPRGFSERRRGALPPLSDGQKRHPPTPTEKLWGIQLESVDVQLQELWVSEFRYLGPATLRGGFSLQPRVHAQIFPSELVFRGGLLRCGEESPLVSALVSTVRASTPPLETSRSSPVWKELSTEVVLRAEVADTAPLGAFFPRFDGLRDGKGPIEVQARLERAKVVGDVRVKYRSERLRYEHRLFDARGAVSFSAQAAASDKTLELHTDVAVATLRTRSKAELRIEDFVIGLHMGRDVAEPSLQYLASKGKVVAFDAKSLVDLTVIPPELDVSGGTMTGAFEAETRGKAVVAKATAQMDDVSLATEEWRVRLSGRAGGTWTAPLAKFTSGELADGVVDIRGLDVKRPGDLVNDWRVRLAFPKLTVRAEPLLVSGSFDAFAEDIGPALQLAGVDLPEPASSVIGSKSLHVTGRAQVTAARQDVTVDRSLDAFLGVAGRVVRLERGTYGAFLFEVSPFSVGAHFAPNDFRVSLSAGQDWLEAELAKLPK